VERELSQSMPEGLCLEVGGGGGGGGTVDHEHS
jgi:hypothetical protein